jgi:hypothetical protein
VEVLKKHKTAQSIYEALHSYFQQRHDLGAPVKLLVHHALQALEVLVLEGWVQGSVKPGLPYLKLETPVEGDIIHTNRD